jgi:hypothetical protein
MKTQNYNGWTNYATWRVNLEIFDGMNPAEMWTDLTDVYELGQTLKAYAEELIDQSGAHGIAVDYALAFLSYVDWREIAQHMADDYELFTDEIETKSEGE